MLVYKAESEIFKALQKHDMVVGWAIGDDRIAVTVDGFKAHIFKKKDISFDVSKVEMLPESPVKYQDCVKNECKIKRTEYFILIKHETKQQIMRIFNNHRKAVYANDKFFKCFERPNFYQKSGEVLSPIVVTETEGRREFIVGFVLPIRVTLDDDIQFKTEV